MRNLELLVRPSAYLTESAPSSSPSLIPRRASTWQHPGALPGAEGDVWSGAIPAVGGARGRDCGADRKASRRGPGSRPPTLQEGP
ncbi:hypothetical protein NDU88_001384 [Pleurodeles waltl]|uniref:Uncharacterized protein n=1 Tax=Pleurodeles waltl TaxID=8319 RepID=A0AAV7P3Z9_PLEWA|nr:hypothetical protein NDU88_001384 [Pleurodeles waltl]